jgi:UDP-N-acetylmuramyl pentapeptide phosphotransferase/UDP-N-acetylglucosamine-1-phosphate transferase
MSIFLYPILSLLSALLVVNAVIPEVIRVAAAKGLFDVPGGRKGHAAPTPTAGGIAIFMGVMVAAFGWGGSESLNTFQPLMLGMVVLFFLGLKDDLMGASAGFKLMIQLALAAVLVGGGMGLHAFWGMLGWHGLPLPLQYAASVLLVVLVTNAYNLIDGIDGLAGGIGLIASLCFGIIFMVRGEAAFAILAFALAGGLLAFLRYNFQPAKIFMGDTGSLVVGFLLSAMMLHLLERERRSWRPTGFGCSSPGDAGDGGAARRLDSGGDYPFAQWRSSFFRRPPPSPSSAAFAGLESPSCCFRALGSHPLSPGYKPLVDLRGNFFLLFAGRGHGRRPDPAASLYACLGSQKKG